MNAVIRMCSALAGVMLGVSAHAQEVSAEQNPDARGVEPASETMSPAPESAAFRHVGMHLRVDTGLGRLSYSERVSSGVAKMSGLSGSLGASLGGAVVENLIVSGRAFLLTTRDQESTISGQTTNTDIHLGLVGVGPEITYYFMPINVHVSAALAMTYLRGESHGVKASSEVGLGTQVTIGKSWWMNDQWGLGVAGQLTYSSNRDGGPTISIWNTGLVFSVTRR